MEKGDRFNEDAQFQGTLSPSRPLRSVANLNLPCAEAVSAHRFFACDEHAMWLTRIGNFKKKRTPVMENHLSADNQKRLDDLLVAKNRVEEFDVIVTCQGRNSSPFQVVTVRHRKDPAKYITVPIYHQEPVPSNPREWINRLAEWMDGGAL